MRRPSAYRVFLTRNSEYHVRGATCFGVRDRRTGKWLVEHAALGRPLGNSYADAGGRMISGQVPMIGDPLTFVVDGQSVVTSAILSIEVRDHLHGGRGHYERAMTRRPPLCPRETH